MFTNNVQRSQTQRFLTVEPAQAIMIVEDEPAIRQLYSLFLSQKGLHVIEAQDGACALETFKSYPCQLVLTGLYMPRLGGLELSRELRKLKPDVYIIMVTAAAWPGVERAALCSGVNEFIPKPFDFLYLEERILSAFQQNSLSG